MSAVAPYSDIYFCNVPWDSSYRHVCDGATPAGISQTLVKLVTNYTYVQRDSMIRVAAPMDELIGANYVMYRNKAHENRWMYAFIDRIEYINEGVTGAYIRTDVYQTWRNQATVKPCFVIREHVADDTPGNYLVPEGLDVGEAITADMTPAGLGTLRVVVAVTEWKDGSTWTKSEGGIYNGSYAGVDFYAFAHTDVSGINAFIAQYVSAGKTDAIVAIFMMPSAIIGNATGALTDVWSYYDTVTAPARPTAVDGYTPKNAKVLTHPYVYLYAQNNNGGAAVFRYEHFTAAPQFLITGNIGINPSVKLYPLNKRTRDTTANNLAAIRQYGEEALTITGWPMVIWNNSVWQQYISSQGAQAAATLAGSALALGVGVFSGQPLAVAGGVLGAAQQVGALIEKQIVPAQAHGSPAAGNANLSYAASGDTMQDVVFTLRTLRAEQARIVDEFFTMYGYKINRVKKPALNGRRFWNHIQTNDAMITGPIPDADRKEYEAILNRGTTIWHTMSDIGNYTLLNEVVAT